MLAAPPWAPPRSRMMVRGPDPLLPSLALLPPSCPACPSRCQTPDQSPTCSVAESCPILYNLMDCSPPGSSVRRIFQARISRSRLPFPTPGGLSDPGIKPESPALAGRFFTTEPPGKPKSPWMTKMNSRGRHLHHPGHVISSFLQSQGCVLTTPFSVVGWDNLWASPWGQALRAGQTLFIPQAQHVANFTHGPQVLHRTLFPKFLVASSRIPPSLPPSPLWGKKTTISAHGNAPQLLAGPACPLVPMSTASSVPPGFHRVSLLPSRP